MREKPVAEPVSICGIDGRCTHRGRRWIAYVIVWVVLWCGSAAGYAKLRSAVPSQKPELIRDTLLYTLDLKFSERPKHYWIYFDHVKNSLVLDCYGMYLDTYSERFPRSTPFQSITTANFPTEMSFSGKQSKIIINLDARWHYTTEELGETIIRVSIWKLTKVKSSATGKRIAVGRSRSRLYIAAIGLVGVIWLTTGIILLSSRE